MPGEACTEKPVSCPCARDSSRESRAPGTSKAVLVSTGSQAPCSPAAGTGWCSGQAGNPCLLLWVGPPPFLQGQMPQAFLSNI